MTKSVAALHFNRELNSLRGCISFPSSRVTSDLCSIVMHNTDAKQSNTQTLSTSWALRRDLQTVQFYSCSWNGKISRIPNRRTSTPCPWYSALPCPSVLSATCKSITVFEGPFPCRVTCGGNSVVLLQDQRHVGPQVGSRIVLAASGASSPPIERCPQ